MFFLIFLSCRYIVEFLVVFLVDYRNSISLFVFLFIYVYLDKVIDVKEKEGFGGI